MSAALPVIRQRYGDHAACNLLGAGLPQDPEEARQDAAARALPAVLRGAPAPAEVGPGAREQKDPGADGSHYSLCDGLVAAASLLALVYHIPMSTPLHLPRALACCVSSDWFTQRSQLMLVLPRFWRRARAATSWCGCPTCTRSCAATPAALRTRTLPRCADPGVYSLGVSRHMRGAPAVSSTRR